MLLSIYATRLLDIHFVGKKAKGPISKRVLQENKACQLFRKANILTPWYIPVHVRISGSEMSVSFRKHPFWDLLFCLITDNFHIGSRWTEFEIQNLQGSINEWTIYKKRYYHNSGEEIFHFTRIKWKIKIRHLC